MGNAQEIAREVLRQSIDGSVSQDLLEALAEAVLGDEEVTLAMAVRHGGAHAVRRAIELAALLANPVVRANEDPREESVS